MEKQNVKAVLFDLDGTLVHFESDWKEAEANARKFAKKNGIAVDETHISLVFGEIYRKLRGKPRTMREFLSMEGGFESRLIDDGKIIIYPGAKEVLRAVKMKRVKCALVSNNLHESAVRVLDGNGMLQYFDQIICFDDVEKPKPDPEPINEALRRLKVSPSEALFVGDGRTTDLVAANAAGVECVIIEPGEIGRLKGEILARI